MSPSFPEIRAPKKTKNKKKHLQIHIKRVTTCNLILLFLVLMANVFRTSHILLTGNDFVFTIYCGFACMSCIKDPNSFLVKSFKYINVSRKTPCQVLIHIREILKGFLRHALLSLWVNTLQVLLTEIG